MNTNFDINVRIKQVESFPLIYHSIEIFSRIFFPQGYHCLLVIYTENMVFEWKNQKQ